MFLYFIKAEDAIKVGIANDVEERIKNVQVGNPYKVELLHSISFSEEEARKAEAKIHQLFHKTNLSGEWFQANQFMLDFVKQIKEHGWESHFSWLEKRYEDVYGDFINGLRTKIQESIITGNLISLERLKSDLLNLIDFIYLIPSIPLNLAEAVREWIEKREEPFIAKDLWNHFGIHTKKDKDNVRQILQRLTKSRFIERTGIRKGRAYIYKKV